MTSLETFIFVTNDEIVLTHHGVLGMKWGVRKYQNKDGSLIQKTLADMHGVKLRDRDYSLKTKNGESFTLRGDKNPLIPRVIARMSKRVRTQQFDAVSFTMKDQTGRKVGECAAVKDGSTLHLEWIGVRKHARGKGYATAVLRAAIEKAREAGMEKVTLEVFGDAKDAQHIYDRLGFKEVQSEKNDTDSDSLWGGLTARELSLVDNHT